MTATKSKKKVAVLGGGCGALSAAWALTGLPDWKDEFDITVYQMGWRLGGKGASGRNRAHSDRIEEHGLHVWGGFYENAFRVMQECYAEVGGHGALRTWSDAFKKHSAVILEEWVEDKGWVSWPIILHENDEVPGTGTKVPSTWEYVPLLFEWLIAQVVESPIDHETPPPGPHRGFRLTEELEKLLGKAKALEGPVGIWTAIFHRGHPPALTGFSVHDLLSAAERLARHLPSNPEEHFVEDHRSLLHLLEEALARLEEKIRRDVENDDTLRRLSFMTSLGAATIKGLIEDGVITHGFESINDKDWRAWLKEHGASQLALDSAAVRGIYDYVFGYVRGDCQDEKLEAGTATHGVFRLLLTFRGAVFWEMQAGMGDVVFAPLYRALKDRGVRFEFFQKVESLHLSSDGTVVERIDMLEQARPKNGDYQPLFDVKGVPSWPSRPFYAQLDNADELEGVDLESAWAPRVGRAHTLERGRDFDEVVLGISIAALKDVALELIDANDRFRDMVANVQTVQTASMQLWLDPSAEALGAPEPPRAATAYAQYLNTWSDMSYLLERENWPADGAPRFLAYFCGEFPDAQEIPPYSDESFPARELKRYRAMAEAWIENHVAHIWTKAASRDDPEGLDWSLLHDPEARSGKDRLQAQYFRVNIDPTERYVLSLPNTSRYRLRAGESGFANVYLAGDWVLTSINAGCVEAAVMAGLDAAGALSGEPVPIVGGLS